MDHDSYACVWVSTYHNCLLEMLSLLPKVSYWGGGRGLQWFISTVASPNREASSIKKEYCRCPHTPHKWPPPRARPHPKGRAAQLAPNFQDPKGPVHPRQTSPHCTAGARFRTGGLARQPHCSHCTLRGPHTIAGGQPGPGVSDQAGHASPDWGLLGPNPMGG